MSPRPPEIASKTNTVSASSRTIASLGVSWSRLPSEAVEYTEKPSLDNFSELLEVLRDAQGMSSHEDAVNMEVQTTLLATLAEQKKLDDCPFLPESRLTVVREEPSTPTPIWSWIDKNNPPGSYLKDPRESSHEAGWVNGFGKCDHVPKLFFPRRDNPNTRCMTYLPIVVEDKHVGYLTSASQDHPPDALAQAFTNLRILGATMRGGRTIYPLVEKREGLDYQHEISKDNWEVQQRRKQAQWDVQHDGNTEQGGNPPQPRPVMAGQFEACWPDRTQKPK